MYCKGSSKEGGTFQRLRNLINRQNVSEVKCFTGKVNTVEAFVELVVECHLLAAAMHFFSMNSISDSPISNIFTPEFFELILDIQKQHIMEKMG